MAAIARALRHRNYRLFATGQLISLAGTWMQQIAMSWLAYRLTGSMLMLGLISFCSLIPLLPLAPFGGLLADRFDKRLILIGTQVLLLIQALVLAALALSGTVQPWHLVTMSLLMGFINAVDLPTRQAFVVVMVNDRADLPNAIALNSTMYNLARLFGPALGGIVLGRYGEGFCFVLNAVSYLAVIVALLLMRTQHQPRHHGTPLEAIRLALRYVRSEPSIARLILLIAALGFFMMPYSVLFPYFAKQVYGGDARTFGFLMTANGAGALAGVLTLAMRRNVGGLERSIGIATLVAAVAMSVFALANEFWFGMAALATTGYCLFFLLSSSNTVIQSRVQDELRGRVMSLYAMAVAGIPPLGSLAVGWLAEHLNPHATLLGGAFASFAAGLVFLRGNRAATR